MAIISYSDYLDRKKNHPKNIFNDSACSGRKIGKTTHFEDISAEICPDFYTQCPEVDTDGKLHLTQQFVVGRVENT